MKNKFCLFFLFFSGLLIKNFYIKAQVRPTLEKKSKALKNEIKKLNKEANQNKKQTLEASYRLNLLSKKIKARTKLLIILEKEKAQIEQIIPKNEFNINQLEDQLVKLKKQYKEILIKSYKNKITKNKMLWFLTSDSFLQVNKRLKYLEKYIFFQKQKAQNIHIKQEKLSKTLKKLKKNKEEKLSLLAQKEKESSILKKEKQEQDQLIFLLKKEKEKLSIALKKKQEEAKKLETQIKSLIAKEIRIAKEKALKKATISKTDKIKKNPLIVFSKEEIKLSEDFLKEKGKLPWPTKGTLLSKFGKQPYPGLKGVYIENNGIEILAKNDSEVKSIFEGIIKKTYNLANKSIVLIQHGQYYSVYGNLEMVKVKKGEKVSAGQTIGEIREDNDGQKVLIFQLWYNTSKKDPSLWLKSL